MKEKADYAEEQILNILQKIKKKDCVSRVDLDDLILSLEEDALNKNLDSDSNITKSNILEESKIEKSTVPVTKEAEKPQGELQIRTSYLLKAEDLDDLLSDITREKETKFNKLLRKQFEKFILDLEMYNASTQDPNLANLLKKMERFSDDLKESGSVIEIRYKTQDSELRSALSQVKDLQALTKKQEQDLFLQIEEKEEAQHQMKVIKEEVSVIETKTKDKDKNIASREKDLE